MATTPKKFKSTVDSGNLGGYTTLAQEKAGTTKGVPTRKPSEPTGGGLTGMKGKFVAQTAGPPRQPSQPVRQATTYVGSDPRNIGGGSAINAATAAPAAYSPTYVPTGLTNAVGGGSTTPLTGFAANFRPEAVQAALGQPETILNLLMQKAGMNPSGAGAGLMQLGTPYMDALSSVMPLAWGGQMPSGPSDAINWLAKMGQQGLTPGGAAIDFGDVMRSLTGLGSSTPAFNSLFGTGMAPADQVNAVKQIVYGAAQAGLPEFFQRAVQNMMNQSGIDYLTGQYGSAKPAGFNTAMPNFGFGR